MTKIFFYAVSICFGTAAAAKIAATVAKPPTEAATLARETAQAAAGTREMMDCTLVLLSVLEGRNRKLQADITNFKNQNRRKDTAYLLMNGPDSIIKTFQLIYNGKEEKRRQQTPQQQKR